jgi:hypothetical protein
MDISFNRQRPLREEFLAARKFVTDTKDEEVVAARARLRVVRENRAEVRVKLQQACERYRAEQHPGMGANSDMLEVRKLEAELLGLENEVSAAKWKLNERIGVWRPKVMDELGVHMRAPLPTLNKALEEIDAAAVHFELIDNFIRDSGINQGFNFLRLSRDLKRIGSELAEFIKARRR